MPFIEDDWWPPDNEGRMVDLSTCLQDAVVAASGGGAVGELSQAELSSIVSGLALEQDAQEPDPDDILKQLGETAFDNFDTFFTDLTGAHPAHSALQQHAHHVAHAQPPIEIKQEENNNVASPPSSSQLSYNYPNSQPLSLPSGQQRLQQLLRAPGTNSSSRYNIASANPLLAEKLAATSSGIKQEPLSTDYNGTSMNYGNVSPMQRVPSGKPQVHDAGGGKVRGERRRPRGASSFNSMTDETTVRLRGTSGRAHENSSSRHAPRVAGSCRRGANKNYLQKLWRLQ